MLTSQQFYKVTQTLSIDCKKLLEDKPFIADNLDELRSKIDLFGKCIKKLNDALLAETPYQPFNLNNKPAEEISLECKTALQAFNQAQNHYLHYQQKELPKLERQLTEDRDINLKKLTDTVEKQIESLTIDQQNLGQEISCLSKSRAINYANNNQADKNYILARLKENKDTIETIREKKKKAIVELDQKTNTLNAQFEAAKKSLSIELKRLETEMNVAEEKAQHEKERLKHQIELQKKLYESSSSSHVMAHCLHVYHMFNQLIETLLSYHKKEACEKESANDNERNVSIEWITPAQIIKQLLDLINQSKHEISYLLKKLWCPEKNNNDGITLYSTYNNKNGILSKNNDDQKSSIKRQDLNSKIVLLPRSLVEHDRESKQFSLWKKEMPVKQATKKSLIIIENYFSPKNAGSN